LLPSESNRGVLSLLITGSSGVLFPLYRQRNWRPYNFGNPVIANFHSMTDAVYFGQLHPPI
jgi:hypothetical protein